MAARVYLRPTGFIDTPFGFDGQVARLAGGLLWFALVELIRLDVSGGRSSELVPVAAVEQRIADLPELEADEARRAWTNIIAGRQQLQIGERRIRLEEPQVVGVLNVTPDSFSDGGRYSGDAIAAAEQGFAMAAAGAAIVEVGGESTRPGATPLWEGDEIGRVTPVVQRLASSGTALSLDTRKATVMEAALAVAPMMINDVSGLTFDARSAEVAAHAGVPVVLMHHQGTPETMQQSPHYDRPVLLEVFDWLGQRIEAAVSAGVERSRIIIDPGIGFGKTLQHNLQLLSRLDEIAALGRPVVLGTSRKSFLGRLTGREDTDDRLPGTIATSVLGLERGARVFRVHEVREVRDALVVAAATLRRQ